MAGTGPKTILLADTGRVSGGGDPAVAGARQMARAGRIHAVPRLGVAALRPALRLAAAFARARAGRAARRVLR
ncbi:hypothetical protein [Rhodovulum sp. 12E13]|uniref:hypothetical protein n=1 Tax=Rhodovulum sp. 12E13 TaxID=2203891 RepID=UPI0018F3417B|nr:hypothetical protein [Rhodovulum sp. 12E13]